MDQVKDFLASYGGTTEELALATRGLVLDLLPDAVESVDRPAKMIAYSLAAGYKGVICTIMPAKSHVSLGVSRGADLPDPANLLEGTGKVHRHIKVRTSADVARPELRALLQAAVSKWREDAAIRSGRS